MGARSGGGRREGLCTGAHKSDLNWWEELLEDAWPTALGLSLRRRVSATLSWAAWAELIACLDYSLKDPNEE